MDVGHADRIVLSEDISAMENRIYVCEEEEWVGPFASHEDADCFIALIELLSGSVEGIKKVEVFGEVVAHANSPSPVRGSLGEKDGSLELRGRPE